MPRHSSFIFWTNADKELCIPDRRASKEQQLSDFRRHTLTAVQLQTYDPPTGAIPATPTDGPRDTPPATSGAGNGQQAANTPADPAQPLQPNQFTLAPLDDQAAPTRATVTTLGELTTRIEVEQQQGATDPSPQSKRDHGKHDKPPSSDQGQDKQQHPEDDAHTSGASQQPPTDAMTPDQHQTGSDNTTAPLWQAYGTNGWTDLPL